MYVYIYIYIYAYSAQQNAVEVAAARICRLISR